MLIIMKLAYDLMRTCNHIIKIQITCKPILINPQKLKCDFKLLSRSRFMSRCYRLSLDLNHAIELAYTLP